MDILADENLAMEKVKNIKIAKWTMFHNIQV
jgi:hypothetical protein